jgi:hypothetical protein
VALGCNFQPERAPLSDCQAGRDLRLRHLGLTDVSSRFSNLPISTPRMNLAN